MIVLWETRNEELHRKSKSEQSTRLLQRQKAMISKLLSMKTKCMSRDHFLFPSDPSSLLEETSTTKLANWIATRTQLIKVSVQQALKLDIQNTNPLTKWFTPRNTSKPQKMQWHRNRLLHDPYNKKKRHKRQCNSTSNSTKKTQQTTLMDHLI